MQFKSIAVKSVSLKNFRCHKDFSASLEKINTVEGDNGVGKSSIADAIAYALTGCTYYGEQKNIDRLTKDNEDEMSVCLEFLDENDNVHKLIRKKSRNGNTVIEMDGMLLKQNMIDNMIASKDVVLSIINPLYFIENMADTTGRELLISLLPPISDSEIRNLLPESAKTALENRGLLDPVYFIKTQREQKRNIESTLNFLEGRLDALTREKDEIAAFLCDYKGVNIESEIEALENNLIAIDKNGLASKINALKEEKLDFEKSLQVKLAESKNEEAEKLSSLEKMYAGYDRSLDMLNNKKFSFEHESDIFECQEKLKITKLRYDKMKSRLDMFKTGDRCTVCLQVLDEKNLERVKNQIKEELKCLLRQGHAYNDSLKHLLAQKEEAYKNFKDELASVSNQLKNKMRTLAEKIQKIRADYEQMRKNISHETSLRIAQIEESIRNTQKDSSYYNTEKEKSKIAERLGLLHQAQNFRARLDEVEKNIAETVNNLKKLEADLKSIDEKIAAAKLYAATRAEKTIKPLNDAMNRTKIILFDVNKSSGEVVDCFKFLYDGRDYKVLSLSEKIKAGLEVSAAIKKITGLNLPVVVDNTESVSAIDNIDLSEGQFIFLEKTKGKLKITNTSRFILPIEYGLKTKKVKSEVA